MQAELAAELKAYARETLGFALTGITTAQPLAGAPRLLAWLARGAHGEMAYLARTAAVRCDPGRFLPGARSVIVVALSYRDADPAPTCPTPGRLVVARYAQRRDYHAVIRRRLVRLGRLLAQRLPGRRWRPAVDTGPLLERELAQRAGLGWIGKNTCLIHRQLGSELLLGALVTDAELPPDSPARPHCGRCTACLAACPTGALVAPGVLDARRCIAYLTLEHRSPFTPEEARQVAGFLAGCDLCQEVCPWNRRALARCDPALAPRPALRSPSRGALASLDEAGWRHLAAGTPLRRLDFSRFSRNLAAARAGRGALSDCP